MAKVQRDTLLKSILSTDLYQRKQGRAVRRCTAGAIFLTFVLASQALYHTVLLDFGTSTASAVVAVINVIGAWFAFRVVNYPVFADFLIDVESEMTKVTWPSWVELQRATLVVLATTFLFSALLFGYDIAWQKFLEMTGVLRLSR
ncbi:preprotein translocase subunit SecE [Schlesneria sp. T3-172]|uniref:preprotein translocase subunit SecE n=1 Tax=Schlesneria TaxID=656899 RepID=UPI002EE8C8D3